ncbi:hypothetical protein ACIQTN_26025 [Streptomyces werraensis]|uniref:hypothetical protein n=1 Tax=Streptomyces werraensis TaxID=68284 RepID=UPI00380C1E7E
MSAPVAVNTADGTCWTRRGEKRDGEALYAPEGVCNCPPFVMATLAELAEHGIVGSAYALPVPVREEPQPRGVLDRARDAVDARMSKDALRHVLQNVIAYAADLEAQRDRRRARLVALQNDALTMRGSLAPADGPRAVPFELGEKLAPAVDWLIARVAELEARLAKSVEAYPGELVMLRGLVATLRVVAEHGDLADVVKLLDEHQRDEQDAYAETGGDA